MVIQTHIEVCRNPQVIEVLKTEAVGERKPLPNAVKNGTK